jgi:hypothetical protein
MAVFFSSSARTGLGWAVFFPILPGRGSDGPFFFQFCPDEAQMGHFFSGSARTRLGWAVFFPVLPGRGSDGPFFFPVLPVSPADSRSFCQFCPFPRLTVIRFAGSARFPGKRLFVLPVLPVSPANGFSFYRFCPFPRQTAIHFCTILTKTSRRPTP